MAAEPSAGGGQAKRRPSRSASTVRSHLLDGLLTCRAVQQRRVSGAAVLPGEAQAASKPSEAAMNFRKLFQLLVVGGAAVGGLAGCATTSAPGTDASNVPKSNIPPPAMGSGGIRGW
jgi:hypothetical protein